MVKESQKHSRPECYLAGKGDYAVYQRYEIRQVDKNKNSSAKIISGMSLQRDFLHHLVYVGVCKADIEFISLLCQPTVSSVLQKHLYKKMSAFHHGNPISYVPLEPPL